MATTGNLDPRQQRTRARVFSAARAVMRRDGVGGTTVDAVADEAGVARSTVYRNWHDLDDLLAQAVDDAAGEVEPPPPGAAIDRIRTVVLRLTENLYDSEWGRTLPAIVAAAESSPVLADRYRAFTDARRRELKRVIRAGIATGELPAALRPDDVVDALVGPIFYRRLIRRVPTPASWAGRHVDDVLASYGPS